MEGAREGEGWLRSHPLAEAGLPVTYALVPAQRSAAQHSIAQHKSKDLGHRKRGRETERSMAA
jgi:hypothetical protein